MIRYWIRYKIELWSQSLKDKDFIGDLWLIQLQVKNKIHLSSNSFALDDKSVKRLLLQVNQIVHTKTCQIKINIPLILTLGCNERKKLKNKTKIPRHVKCKPNHSKKFIPDTSNQTTCHKQNSIWISQKIHKIQSRSIIIFYLNRLPL